MAMRAHLLRLPFLHVETILQLVVVTQLLWYGKVILMKTNKNLLKILVLKLVKIIVGEFLQLIKENQLQREQQQDFHKRNKSLLLRSHKLEELLEQVVTSIMILTLLNQTIQMPSEEVEKS